MEEFQKKITLWWGEAMEFAKNMTPEQWAMVAGGFVVLLILRWIIKLSKRSKKTVSKPKNMTISPVIKLHTLQIAPLGRDAFLKIENTGELATLTKLEIIGRDNIHVRNALAGHKLNKGKIYSVLLETTDKNKITDGFEVKISYLNTGGQVFTQSFIAEELKK